MTDAELRAIEARSLKATAGPWETWSDLVVGGPTIENRPGLCRGGSGTICQMEENDFPEQVVKANQRFIAHARDDVPALVAEVKRLRALIGEEAQ